MCWFIHYILILSSLILLKSAAEDQIMVCKPVSSLFETRPTNSTKQNQFPATDQDCRTSRPGKQGPRGLRGPPGPVGPPGEAANQSELITRLQSELRMIQRKFLCIDGVVVGDICYKLIYRAGVRVNYETARSICALHGMALTEIPTEEVYNALYNYVQRTWYVIIDQENLQYVQLWLGMTYDGRGNVILTSGRRGYVRWMSSYPRANAGNRVGFEVITKPGYTVRDVFNVNPNHVAIPLCQFELE